MSRKWKQMVWVVLQGIKSSVTRLSTRNCDLVIWDDFISISSVGLAIWISVLLLERDIREILDCFWYGQSLCTAGLTSSWVKAEVITLAVSLFAQVCERVRIFRLPCKKVDDPIGGTHECTVSNTACLSHFLSLSKFVSGSFIAGFRSLKH